MPLTVEAQGPAEVGDAGALSLCGVCPRPLHWRSDFDLCRNAVPRICEMQPNFCLPCEGLPSVPEARRSIVLNTLRRTVSLWGAKTLFRG